MVDSFDLCEAAVFDVDYTFHVFSLLLSFVNLVALFGFIKILYLLANGLKMLTS